MEARYSRAVFVTVMFLGASLVGSTARAGAGRHDRPEERYLKMAEQFPAVGSVVGMFTDTLIAPQWVLTCAHGAEVLDRIGDIFGDNVKRNLVAVKEQEEHYSFTLLKAQRL